MDILEYTRLLMTAEIYDDGDHGVLFILNARSQYLQEWMGVVVDLPLFQAAAVVPAGVMFDCHRRVSGLQQHEVEYLSPGAPISVGEGMDVLEERMESGDFQDGVRRRGAKRLNERFDILVYLQWVRRLHTVVAVMRAMYPYGRNCPRMTGCTSSAVTSCRRLTKSTFRGVCSCAQRRTYSMPSATPLAAKMSRAGPSDGTNSPSSTSSVSSNVSVDPSIALELYT